MSEDTGKVQLAYLHRDDVSHSWHESMWQLYAHDRAGSGHLTGKPIPVRTHPIAMVQSRNMVTKVFLDHTEAEWLFWVDTDMGFRPDALDRLMAAADPVTAPVVGGLCFGLWPTGYDGMGGLRFEVRNTMFRIGTRVKDEAPVFTPMPAYPPDTVVQVHATGSAFVLIHRSVLEKVKAEHGEHWYDQLVDGAGEVMGEDISFCLRVDALGIPMFVDTGTPTTHHKELWIGEQDWVAQADEQQAADPAPMLPPFTHIPASLDALRKNEHEHDDMWKLTQDLDRYAQVIADTRPEVVVETGTFRGASARWFADHDVDVITVDVQDAELTHDSVTPIVGDSADPAVVEQVRALVAGRRCMVVLDSDHSASHVRREIEQYGPLVSRGCYLVVEDTIFAYSDEVKAQHDMADVIGSPLDAVVSHLVDNWRWSRDVAIEQTHPVGANPAGWWVRNG